jgi:hypothetical protein
VVNEKVCCYEAGRVVGFVMKIERIIVFVHYQPSSLVDRPDDGGNTLL